MHHWTNTDRRDRTEEGKLKRKEYRGNIIIKVEREKDGSPWSIIYYKIPRGHKVYTIFMYSKLITENGVDFNGFKGRFKTKQIRKELAP
jgi:hypothetical protein